MTENTTDIIEVKSEIIEAPEHVITPMPTGSYKLTPIQLRSAQHVVENEMILKRKGHKRKTYAQLAAGLGIAPDSLLNYRGMPEFQRYIKDASMLMINESMAMATARLYQLADGSISGNPSIRAIEMIMTMAGVLNKTQQHEITVKQPDSLAKVSDAELAELVAEYEDIPLTLSDDTAETVEEIDEDEPDSFEE